MSFSGPHIPKDPSSKASSPITGIAHALKYLAVSFSPESSQIAPSFPSNPESVSESLKSIDALNQMDELFQGCAFFVL